MKKSFVKTLLIATVVGAAMVSSVAPAFEPVWDDVQVPFWRGQPGTTLQAWHFNQSNLGPLAPDPDNRYGPWLPSTQITVQPLGDWIQIDQGPSSDPENPRFGIWPLSGRMNVIVDNYPAPNPVKYMWVQVTWQHQAGLPQTGPVLGDFNPMGTVPEAVGPVDLGFGWFETTFKWEIRPNPLDEIFVLSGNINVEQLIVDTWCIPEPSALLLATLGGGLLLVPRLRRRR